ncbi:DUF937 domain-containing protein [Nocardioides sp.]|uniref:DUF937 domain-containing protein n=1 Tax=Nocardioides sp. TaxID=35761 RepID=UPI00352758B3
MSAVDEILASLPLDQLAASLGESPAAVEQAAAVALPALLGGLEANAKDPAGEASLARALAQHDGSLASGTVDLGQVDVADGDKIARHIFGAQHDQVVRQLGGVGGSSGLVSKLLPILAPIVLSYLAKQAGAKDGALGGGVLGGILSQILTGAAQGSGSSRSPGTTWARSSATCSVGCWAAGVAEPRVTLRPQASRLRVSSARLE